MYTIFFSWQSSRPNVKKAIKKSLRMVVKELLEEGFDICLDQDTWNRVGKKRIEVEVLNKIDQCDIFIADLTPVCKLEADEEENRLEKLQPNANVMFEYGYALKAKGEERMILLANLEKGEHVEQLPFDINHDTITGFTMEKGVPNLTRSIKKIIERIDEDRKNEVKELDCGVFFEKDMGLEEIIHPVYRRVHYVHPLRHEKSRSCDTVDILTMTSFEALSAWTKSVSKTGKMVVPEPLVTAKIISGERNLSYYQLKLCLTNLGSIELNNCHLTITSDNAKVVFKDTNEERNLSIIVALSHKNVIVHDETVKFHCDILNPNMWRSLDKFYVVVPHDVESFMLHWSMQSTRHYQEGNLLVHVEPEYRDECVENDCRAGEIVVEDYKEEF